MNQFFSHLLSSLPYLATFALLLCAPAFSTFAWVNAVLQSVLFAAVVIVPALRTGRMAYVDIGWPLGLFLIGAQVLVMSEPLSLRSGIIASLYLLAGGRMAGMALIAWRLGHFSRELPRYQYQRLRWQRRLWRATPALLFEVASQGMANMSVLALPAILLSSNPTATIASIEWLGFALWIAALALESIADAQKLRSTQRMQREGRRREHCEVGLWRYCRHPNYFAEWMLWIALLLASLPSLLLQAAVLPAWITLGLLLALIYMAYLMYAVLTQYSGAVPSEHYSAQKRPGYADYQRRVPMFFPRRPRPSEPTAHV